MTQINYKESNTNSSVGAVVENGSGQRISVRLSWGFSTSAPVQIAMDADYRTPSGGLTFTASRRYTSDLTYSPVEDVTCEAFDTTFDNAVKALVQSCFENYSNVNLIAVEE